jgi:hypothetical protein
MTCSFKGQAFRLPRPYGSYVIENVLFKISFPAEFHAQTAVECAVELHPQVAGRLAGIDRSSFARTNRRCASSTRRGRCTIPPTATIACSTWSPSRLINGRTDADADYEDDAAADPRIDALRAKWRSRRTAVLGGLSGPGQALDRQRAAGLLRRRQPDAGTDANTRWALPSARRRHSGAGREVQEAISHAGFRRAAGCGSSSRRSMYAVWGAGGQRRTSISMCPERRLSPRRRQPGRPAASRWRRAG